MKATKFFSGFGRHGFWKKGTALEIGKFSLYLMVPVGASVLYANPPLMHALIKRLSFVTYPQPGPTPPDADEILERLKRDRGNAVTPQKRDGN